MALLSLLPPLLPLLLAVPAGSAEGAAAALTPERLLEWQGECPPAQRDQMGTSGAGASVGGAAWGGASARRRFDWAAAGDKLRVGGQGHYEVRIIHYLLSTPDKGIFIIQSENLEKCIQAGKSTLTLESCKPPNKYMLWKWASNHRLFNIGGSGCLGLNVSNPEQPLSIYECDSTHISLKWRCNRKMITGPLQYMVQVKHDNTLVASWKYLHKWVSYMSGGGGICEYLNKDLYTIKGNAHGTPCMFPFQYNRQWHHECTREGREDNLLWCATTSRYERDEKFSFFQFSTVVSKYPITEGPEGWERHGGFCYKIDTVLRSFDHASSGYYCPPALVTITNRIATRQKKAFILSLVHPPTSFREYLGLEVLQSVFHSEKVLTKRTWREAEEFCEEFGAHLASFAHIEEENFVNELLHSKFNRTEERQFWIGFNKRNPLNAGSWEWSDGTPDAEYLFHTSATEWSSFEFVCGWLRSDILTIHSEREQEFIHGKIRALSKYGVNWWIGLREERVNDEFRWRDGSPVIYQNWDKGKEESMINQSQRCGFISSITGLWASEECSVSMPSICKRKKFWIIEKEKGTPKKHGTCPKGWLYFDYKCLLMKIPKDPSDWKNWTSAQDFCVEEGGTLVAIENEVEQAFITMNLFGHTTNVWIGLQNDDYEKWLNGRPVSYSNWSPFDIVNIPTHNTTEVQKRIPLCALLSNNPNFHFTGKWYFEDCREEGYGFVCEKMQDTSGHSINTSDMYPIPNTLEYGNRTYKIINENMTWYTALKTCLMHGAELVSITDQYHQSFLTVILNRLGHAHWIGLFTEDNGLNFDWSDGTKSSFTFWKDDESSFLGDCVFADTSGHWSSTACESYLQGAICHVPTETRPFGYPELCSETSIPWIKFKSNCYSFSTVLDSTSFDAAHEFCKKEGSNLLTIKDEAENSFLLDQLLAFSSSVKMVWLNAQFDGDNETIKWFDGTLADQSNWGIRKPEMDHVKPHLCVALRIPEGVWQLSSCQDKKGFICKMEAGPSHSIIPLAVAVTLIIILAISTLSFCIYKHNSGIFRRLAQFGNPYYPATNFSTVHLEENILISDLEKNDQ
ncbi:hypothetical protein EI555_004869 [Monodon monoceros]|uniref:Phospholipase A2 receptor 1 n=1 Tax=Monodon monoceros TaxID=40151 RepID=A0A4U1FHG8_MONMO|nr:hypothetical protein EI555_004869 [Monodon monoceros]